MVDNEFLTLYGEAAANTSSRGLSASEMVAGQFLFTTFQNCLAAARFPSGVCAGNCWIKSAGNWRA